MEATGGFEPPNGGFADPRLNLLATSPSMVPRRGFEPLRAYAHYPLKIACLPIPPPRPLAGVAGFEPATGGFGDRCSTKLSYTPLLQHNFTSKAPRAQPLDLTCTLAGAILKTAMDAKYIPVYFLLGGTVVSLASYFGSHSKGLLAAFISFFPAATVFTVTAIYAAAGGHAASQYARGMLLMLPAWVLYALSLFWFTPRLGLGVSLLIGIPLYIGGALLTMKLAPPG